jgi:thiopurine S-methyltransferase
MKDYWIERWKRSEIGFHQDEINPYLRRYWQELHLPPMNVGGKSEVFVPLCGKSRDMVWLRDQGYSVLGVELSAIAVRAFFEENGYAARHVTREKSDQLDQSGRFGCWEANGIRILQGDFFGLSKDDLSKANAVYDRASLVALPPDMRARYTSHLLNILPPGTQILLVTFDYPQSEMPGPPFAVSTGEVEALYRGRAEIRLLGQVDVLEQNSRFQERGLSRLQESIFLLTPYS